MEPRTAYETVAEGLTGAPDWDTLSDIQRMRVANAWVGALEEAQHEFAYWVKKFLKRPS